jgi:hypothetical protein
VGEGDAIMNLGQSGFGRSILSPGRDAASLADLCHSLDGVPAAVLAAILCRLSSSGLVSLEAPPDRAPTLETTALGLEVLAAFEVFEAKTPS